MRDWSGRQRRKGANQGRENDTLPARHQPERWTEPTRVGGKATRGRRRLAGRSGWRLVAMVLGAAVGLNLCLTSAFWAYSSTLAGDDTPTPGPTATLAPAEAAQATAEATLVGEPTQPVIELGPTATPLIPLPTYVPPRTEGVVTVLLLGIDERPDQAGQPTRTDTMMVLRADFDQGTARVLSFPRDMWVAIPGLEAYDLTANRINTAYFYGERYDLPGGGPALAMQTVTLNFGIRLDHYALINFDGFVKTVDALGGIDLNVPETVYDDQFPTDDYGTTLLYVPAGEQHLDGLTALRYARTRHQDSDFDRAGRQQAVLLAIRDRAISLDAVTKLPELVSVAGGAFRTDMTLPQMVMYAYGGKQIARDQIEMYVIDETYLIGWSGAGGASLFIPDRQKIAVLIEEFLR